MMIGELVRVGALAEEREGELDRMEELDRLEELDRDNPELREELLERLEPKEPEVRLELGRL